jgi:N-acetylglucosaminyldiphosphoundecaprenol N-acetyl-beta-D-mannosaminyltransferase
MNELQHARQRGSVIGVPIDALSWVEVRTALMRWAKARESRYVCICNVHSVVTARQDALLSQIINESDMATPDGAPVAWTLRAKGFSGQERINGPDLMWSLCNDAQAFGVRVGLFGSSPATLSRLETVLRLTFPRLEIAYSVSPPFRQIAEEEDSATCSAMNACGIGLLFVALGCPKQEAWIAAHRGRVHAVMLGVGAAFDYHAGTISRAPKWMRSVGLEWLHRLLSEPSRLWKRYFLTNSVFIFATGRELSRWLFRYQALPPRARR